MYSRDEFEKMHRAVGKSVAMMDSLTSVAYRTSDRWNGEFMLNLALQGYRVAYIEEHLMDSRFPRIRMWIGGGHDSIFVYVVPLDIVLSYEQDMITKQYINF